jgi:hypothetical protein
MDRHFSLIPLTTLLIASPTAAQAQASLEYPEGARLAFVQSFSGLTQVTAGRGTLLYRAAGSEVVNKRRGKLPPNHPLYVGDGFLETWDVVLVKTRITRDGGPAFYVVFTEGSSGDYGFRVIREGGTDESEQLYGEVLALTGDGVAYTFRRTNSMFAKRQQWTFANGEFHEVSQPFYAVVMKAPTLVDVVLLDAPSGRAPVGRVPKGTTVDVLLTDGVERADAMFFLVRTPAGLTGWVRVPIVQYKATVFPGLFWWGD